MSEKHRHEQQIYSLLLQSFWTPPRTPITEYSNSNNHPTEPTDIAEFLGEDLL